MKRILMVAVVVMVALAATVATVHAAESKLASSHRFSISLPEHFDGDETTGRLFLFVAPTAVPEPRLQSNASLFGVDVRHGTPAQRILIDSATPGYPQQSLGDLAPGEYTVQAVFNRYTEFHRADGHVIWAHLDQWEGQHFARSPGNWLSEPQQIRVGPGASTEAGLRLDKTIPPIEIPADTAWVKRIKFQSPLLSRFWGRPIYIGATVLLPQGYDAHASARYPVVYIQNHFSLGAPFGFSPTPSKDGKKSWGRQRAEAAAQKRPLPELPPGVEATGAYANTETGYEFYESWNSATFPRLMLVTFQHPTPYFDDSYGINSPNCGPYGDAILQELIPELERQFRTIQQGYARVLTGSSTGGWGSLALQLYQPDFFGGAWAFSPDPLDFRAYYGGVNLDTDDNAFVEKTIPGLGGGGRSNRRGSQKAAILGTEDGRFEWWKHTPVGADGYPLPVWDLTTGKIDRAVVQAMRANNYDLREFLARKWPEIGSRLVGKLHVYASAVDSFYSNFAVHLLEDFMKATQNPHEPGSFQYGPPASRHGWQPTTHAELLQAMAKHIAEHAPPGENSAAWHY